jgi:AraC family transcriptional regulator
VSTQLHGVVNRLTALGIPAGRCGVGGGVRLDQKQSSVRQWPGMRSEYAWLPPDGTVTTTEPYQVGVSFSAHTQAMYERAGRARRLDIPAGTVFLNGHQRVRWAEVTEPTEALEIYPDLGLLRTVTETPATEPIEIRPEAAVRDSLVLGMAAVLKRVHVGGGDLDELAASTLAHRLAHHVADHYGHRRSTRRPTVGGLDRTLIERVGAYVDDRLGEPLLLDDLAAEARLSAFHFARCFKATTGLTPHEFVTMRRMERAKTLLLTTRDSVFEVAYAVGFSNVGHFRRLLRRYTGFAPADLRAR